MMPERSNAKPKNRPDASRQRVSFVVLLLVLWMLAIGARLVYLQVGQYDYLSDRARRQQQQTAKTNALRGLILDRNGRELARSLDVDSFVAEPTAKNFDPRETARKFAAVLGLEESPLRARLEEAREAKRQFVWLARQVDPEQAARVHELKLAGVRAIKEPKRYYPNGALAAHVLGYVGTDDEGLGGVELYQNAALGGEAGKTVFDSDGRHKAFKSFEVEAQPGQSVVLTIDQNIQYQAERVLLAAVAQSRAKSGTVLVLEPHTGEILALANAPTFDPNTATKIAADVRTNQALQNIYEPGSTFKIVAYSAALEEKLVRPDDPIDCQMGSITLFGRTIHDTHAYGTLTITEALAKSSNVAAIKLGMRLGKERMYDYMMRYGFSQKTGIELKGETRGVVRKPEKWHPSSMGSVAMGQEVGVTPIQMAAAFATIANDGLRVAPHLVKEVQDANGQVLQRTQPESHRVVSTETARTLRPMLESVTLNGTAKAAQLDGYTAAGKTGTAQKIDPVTRAYSKTKYVGSFVGFAPAENPAVVIIVVIDEPVGGYYGGIVAAPVFREIAESVLPYLGVAPDTDFTAPAEGRDLAQDAHADEGDAGEATLHHAAQPTSQTSQTSQASQAMLPQVVEQQSRGAGGVREVVYAAAAERALLMPDIRGRSVRDAARICAQLGLELEAHGEGRATSQSPAAGARIEAGQTVRVEFGRSD
ncbi:MAG TPA: penicillin-binding protein [Pyrinomonadaceae bacterium]|nr:penicillin-binding protein [Pyrinomonadaceae bacterium]